MQSGSQSVPETPITPTAPSADAAIPASGNLRISPENIDQPQRRSWPRIIGISLLVVLLAVVGVAYGTYASWRNSGQLATGIITQGENVGGLKQKEASERLKKRFGRLFLTVQTPERSYKLSLRELGGQPQIQVTVQNAYWYGRSDNIISNVVRMWTARGAERRMALPVKWNKAQLRRKMWIVANNYRVEGRDAGLQVVNGEVQIIPEVEGRAINVGDTLQKLQQHYYVGLPATTATVRNVQPRLTAADLQGKDIKMADYTTRFDAGIRGRTTNIRLVARAVDGQVVMPGETFSFNATTGERTAAKGYRIAHIFVRKPGAAEAEVVEGLGGGTCQVSSTLFNAVRKANKKNGKHLKIVERNTHSLPVTYVPTGLDATVAWPYKDFRFRNKFPHPIYLRTAVSRSHLTISVWGRVPDSMDSNSVIADPTDPERHAENF